MFFFISSFSLYHIHLVILTHEFIKLLIISIIQFIFYKWLSFLSVWQQYVSCLFWALRQHLTVLFVRRCTQSVAHVYFTISLWPVNIAYAVFRRFLSIESSIDVVHPSQHLLPQNNIDPRIENLVPGGEPYGKKVRRIVWNLLQRNVCYNSYL